MGGHYAASPLSTAIGQSVYYGHIASVIARSPALSFVIANLHDCRRILFTLPVVSSRMSAMQSQ